MLKKDQSINELCLQCEKPSCDGICDEMRKTMGEIDESKRIQTLTWGGITHTVRTWAEILGIPRRTLYNYLGKTTDMNEIMQALLKTRNTRLPSRYIEKTYSIISIMHLDYKIYWERYEKLDGSAGFIASYGTIRSAPTNAVSNPTLNRALPEVMLSDEALYKRAWIACVIFMIEKYRQQHKDKERIKSRILEWRAIYGYTLPKIAELLNEDLESWERRFTVNGVRKILENIIIELSDEANERGLFRNQK